MVETFYELDELETAIEAVRSVSSLPIVATLTFDEGAETLAGVNAADAAERLRPLNLAAIGANHGSGLHAALSALEAMSSDDGPPLAALPNVGLASLSGGRVIYPHATPEYFAEFAAHARHLGARLIGGCCGTTPVEIAAIRSAVEEEREPAAPLESLERELPEPALAGGPYETELARMLREGEWVTCVELDPPKGGTYDSMLAVARTLKASGKVGFVDINDNPMARARANALMAAVAIERDCDLETIPHLTPRDTSIMGLESLLLGAHAEGVRNVLSVTGDPPEVGDYPGSQGVYDVDSIGLSKIVSHLNRGEDYNGKGIDAPTSFFLGVAVNPSADDLETELDRFRQKVEAGAKFAMTQALFDLSYLDRFEERLGGWPLPVLVGIFYVRSYQLAVRLHNEVPGIVVPESVQRRLEQAGPNAGAEGLALARELYAEAREKAAGVYVIPAVQAARSGARPPGLGPNEEAAEAAPSRESATRPSGRGPRAADSERPARLRCRRSGERRCRLRFRRCPTRSRFPVASARLRTGRDRDFWFIPSPRRIIARRSGPVTTTAYWPRLYFLVSASPGFIARARGRYSEGLGATEARWRSRCPGGELIVLGDERDRLGGRVRERDHGEERE